jgi:hypothetical protein
MPFSSLSPRLHGQTDACDPRSDPILAEKSPGTLEILVDLDSEE